MDTFWFDCIVEPKYLLDRIKQRSTYGRSDTLTDTLDTDLSQLEKLFIKTEDIRDACKVMWDVHLLYWAAQNGNGRENDKAWYVINKLRDLVKYIFSKDIDFITSSNTLTNRKCNKDFVRELIVPQFEYNKDVSYMSNTINCPVNSKTKLLKEYKNKTATPFQMEFKPCRCSSKYLKWLNQKTQNIDCYAAQYQLYYESYVIIRNNTSLPRHDERFNGYGFDAVVHIEALTVADR